MGAFDPVLLQLQRLGLDRLANLRPAYPPVAFEVDRDALTIVRLRPRRRAKALLEAWQSRHVEEAAIGASILRPNLGAPETMARKVKELFEATGTKPGKVSIVLPDNLARVTMIQLPERPASRRQLDDLLRFRLRRAVPFRLEEAVISHHVLGTDGPAITLLVAVMLRSVVEQYEAAFLAAGARPGLVDLSTIAVYNLCRADMARAAGPDGGDVALLNCARGYFSLVVDRGGRVVFFRCKSQAPGDENGALPTALLRELTSSLSYYQDKLSGQGIGTVFVRSTAAPLEEVAEVLGRVGLERVVPVDAAKAVETSPSTRLDAAAAARLAPCVGAAAGRAGA